MESLEPVSARVHAILARESNRAVVFRRGPSDQVAVIGWDRGNDTFLPGQWFHGRIYEYRCDLTPDGKHLLYFAADYARRKEDEDSGAESRFTSWTAISRAPYLKALALWWNGTGWNGGGLFRSNREFWLNRPPERIAETVPERSSREFREVPPPPEFQEEFGWGSPGECPMVYFPRLERDGWRLIKTVNEAGFFYEKPLPGGLRLIKIFCCDWSCKRPGYGVYYENHELRSESGELLLDAPGWRWADYDARRKRIVFAENGAIRALLPHRPDSPPKRLCDFNDMKFEPRPAPY